MSQYWLYRSTNGASNFQYLNTVVHPDSVYMDTYGIQPGQLYAYCLMAVDSAGNQSEFSDTVEVGLPADSVESGKDGQRYDDYCSILQFYFRSG